MLQCLLLANPVFCSNTCSSVDIRVCLQDEELSLEHI